MTRHLKSCLTHPANESGEPGRRGECFHLLVEDAYRPEYWLHLSVPSAAKLEDLDDYLREIWLECCGHLSAFDINGTLYDRGSYGSFMLDLGSVTMDVALWEVAATGKRFKHVYDFGTTTFLTVRCLADLNSNQGQIRLLARNDAPALDCSMCGAPATWVGHAEDDWIAMTVGFCDACAAALEYRLPIVNSPRSGVCGYDGTPAQILAPMHTIGEE